MRRSWRDFYNECVATLSRRPIPAPTRPGSNRAQLRSRLCRMLGTAALHSHYLQDASGFLDNGFVLVLAPDLHLVVSRTGEMMHNGMHCVSLALHHDHDTPEGRSRDAFRVHLHVTDSTTLDHAQLTPHIHVQGCQGIWMAPTDTESHMRPMKAGDTV